MSSIRHTLLPITVNLGLLSRPSIVFGGIALIMAAYLSNISGTEDPTEEDPPELQLGLERPAMSWETFLCRARHIHSSFLKTPLGAPRGLYDHFPEVRQMVNDGQSDRG